MSATFKSDAMFCRYFPPFACQIPEKSGVPSASFGAGAVRFGLPSAPTGTFDGILFHCAKSDAVEIRKIARRGLIWPSIISERLFLHGQPPLNHFAANDEAQIVFPKAPESRERVHQKLEAEITPQREQLDANLLFKP